MQELFKCDSFNCNIISYLLLSDVNKPGTYLILSFIALLLFFMVKAIGSAARCSFSFSLKVSFQTSYS